MAAVGELVESARLRGNFTGRNCGGRNTLWLARHVAGDRYGECVVRHPGATSAVLSCLQRYSTNQHVPCHNAW